MMRPMAKRLPNFRPENPDEGWVTVKVKLRPSWLAALKKEATRESENLHRHVYVSDLLRDSIRLLFVARRIDPHAAQRFVPSDKSEGV